MKTKKWLVIIKKNNQTYSKEYESYFEANDDLTLFQDKGLFAKICKI